MPDFFCIYRTEKATVEIQYESSPGGLLEILDVHISPRRVSQNSAFENRNRRHGLALSAEEEHAEALMPYTVREK